MWFGLVGLRLGLPGLPWFYRLMGLRLALPGLPWFNRLVGLRFGLPGLPWFNRLVGLRFALPGLPWFYRLMGLRLGLPGWMDLSGLWSGLQAFDTPSLLLFPIPALLPASPVMLKLLIRYLLVVPLMPSPTMLPVISSPT